MDLCLSDSESYTLAFLIRSAYVNSMKNRICGPSLLTDGVFEELGFDYKTDYGNLESKNVLFKQKTAYEIDP